jgi:hypothetical protein
MHNAIITNFKRSISMSNEIYGPSRRDLLKGFAIVAGGYAFGSMLIHPKEAIGQSIHGYLEKVPMEARWNLASGSLVSWQVDFYKRLLDKEGRETFLEFMKKNSTAIGARLKEFADRFGLAGNDAKSAAEIMPVMTTIFFGPQQKYELYEATSEKARVKCTSCAFWANVQVKKITDDLCSAYSRYGWEGFAKAVNPKLTSTLVKARPLGDSVCEWTIELKA